MWVYFYSCLVKLLFQLLNIHISIAIPKLYLNEFHQQEESEDGTIHHGTQKRFLQLHMIL